MNFHEILQLVNYRSQKSAVNLFFKTTVPDNLVSQKSLLNFGSDRELSLKYLVPFIRSPVR